MKGLVLSGGEGTRLRPITHTGPKQVVPIANKPVLQYAIEDLKDTGITEIGIILGNKGRKEIQELLGDGSKFGVDITYIVQGNPLGLAHAAGCAKDFVGDDDFVMYLGDNIMNQGIKNLVDSFQTGDYSAGIALQEVDNPKQFGIAELSENGDVKRLIEKPANPPSNLALIGIYVFSPKIFSTIEQIEPSWRGELEITDAIQVLLDNGELIDSHIVEGWWKDTGKPQDILEANRLVLEDNNESIEGSIEETAEVSGRIELKENSIIENGAVIRGPVSIAENSVIKEGSYIGPYTSIGSNSTIEGAHIENSVVIGNTDIVTNDKIVDSLIGRGTDIGSSEDMLPEGRRLVVGENSKLKL